MDEIRKGNALIEFFTPQDPAELEPQQWAEKVNDVIFAMRVLQKVIWGDSQKKT